MWKEVENHKINKTQTSTKNKQLNKGEKNLKKKTKILIVISLIILIILFGILKIQNFILKKIYKTNYSEYVYKYSEENNIDPLLTFAIIKAESNFNRNIKSKSGAIGLMQLMESTALEEAEEVNQEIVVTESLYNPEINIKIGTKYYAKLIKKYNNNMLLALAAYNAGIGNVDKWIQEGIIKEDGSEIENIPFKETNNYVRKIVRDYKIYKQLYK
ncbi:MAG: lytic transglycosylase domain-containing protein [Clostridia bacterium]|nr:lytic transglycosylase domain-containing protein [Clostridia bacterium]